MDLFRLALVLALVIAASAFGFDGARAADNVTALGPLSSQADAEGYSRATCRTAFPPQEWNGAWQPATGGDMGTCSCGPAERQRITGGQRPRLGRNACDAPPSAQQGSCAGCSVACTDGRQANCRQGEEWPGGSPTCVRDAVCVCQ